MQSMSMQYPSSQSVPNQPEQPIAQEGYLMELASLTNSNQQMNPQMNFMNEQWAQS